ncbi:transposable element Tc1 transposase [Trichonephila clavipes]|nr:transposable element Tc1 transposase [Trichonephila clavipes]
MYPLCLILGGSGQGRILPQEDCVSGGHRALLRGGKTIVFGVRLWHIVLRLLRTRPPVACIPLTPSHRCLRRQWCQVRVDWKTEWGSVVFSDERRFCLGANDALVLVRRRPGEHLQPNCL